MGTGDGSASSVVDSPKYLPLRSGSFQTARASGRRVGGSRGSITGTTTTNRSSSTATSSSGGGGSNITGASAVAGSRTEAPSCSDASEHMKLHQDGCEFTGSSGTCSGDLLVGLNAMS